MGYIENALSHYYATIKQAMKNYRQSDEFIPGGQFAPEFDLPALDDKLHEFLQPSGIGVTELSDYGGCSLRLLNLMANPNTRTTKTFGSMINVARAVNHIKQTGDRVIIITPSSGNKATALRHAVQRAVSVGLVRDNELQIVTALPEASRGKLWSSNLSTDSRLRELNPIAVLPCEIPVDVKLMVADFMQRYPEQFYREEGVRLWHSLELRNYMMADMVRALVERDLIPASGRGRMHAHAVSSALGLLGLRFGQRQLISMGIDVPPLQLLLVQHLGAPDMVLSLCHNTFDLQNVPTYHRRDGDGLYAQNTDPHFPSLTFDPAEHLDATFYSRTPVTSSTINTIIRENGGSGVVVSLYECLSRYNEVRGMLNVSGGVALPGDPRKLREWSLVMAVTGVLNAIDRRLVSDCDVVIHASGSYTDDDYEVLTPTEFSPIGGVEDFRQLVRRAADAGE